MQDRPYLDDRSELENMNRRERILNDNYFTYKTIPISKTFKKFFRRIDFYAKPITLRHKGEYKFYTNLGAYTSFIIILVMIGFATYLFINMISGRNFSVDHKIFSYTQEDFPVIDLGRRGFSAGFALFDDKGQLFNDETYFRFSGFTKLYNKSELIPVETIKPLVKCGETDLFESKYNDYF
jgi:hypothetical protein